MQSNHVEVSRGQEEAWLASALLSVEAAGIQEYLRRWKLWKCSWETLRRHRGKLQKTHHVSSQIEKTDLNKWQENQAGGVLSEVKKGGWGDWKASQGKEDEYVQTIMIYKYKISLVKPIILYSN